MSRSSVFVLLGTRAGLEAATLAFVAALFSLASSSRLDVPRAWTFLSGLLLLASALTYGAFSPRARYAAAVGLVLGTIALVAPAGAADLPGAAARVFEGALLGGVVIWRGGDIATRLVSWRASAYAALAGIVSYAIWALVLAPFGGVEERTALAGLGVALAALAVIGLALARGAEEILTVRRRLGRETRAAALAAGTVGLVAVAVAASFSVLTAALGRAADALGPLVERLLVLVVTPFAFVAEILVRAALDLLQASTLIRLLPPQRPSELDDEYVRAVSEQATAFLSATFGLIAALVVLALVLRALRRRPRTASHAEAGEREAIEGTSVVALLRRLFGPRAEPRAARPRGVDPSTRIRRAYWDLLALAERAGARWRLASETPREHLAALAEPPWPDAAPIVAAFEGVRYGRRAKAADADVAEETLSRIAGALAQRA